MKRLLSLITLVFTTIVLVACSSKPNMDGEYYEIGDYGTDLVITIKGDKGTFDAEGSTSSMTIDTDTQTFEISGFVIQRSNMNTKMMLLLLILQDQNASTSKKVVRLIRKNSRSLM